MGKKRGNTARLKDITADLKPPPVLVETWTDAKRNGTDRMTMRQINAEISAYRKERVKSGSKKLRGRNWRTELRQGLKEGAIARSQRDKAIAADWSGIDEDLSRFMTNLPHESYPKPQDPREKLSPTTTLHINDNATFRVPARTLSQNTAVGSKDCG